MFREAMRISTISETYYHYALFLESQGRIRSKHGSGRKKILDKKANHAGISAATGARHGFARPADSAGASWRGRDPQHLRLGRHGNTWLRRMLKLAVVTISKPPIRLLATDIDGTLLNPQFQISDRRSGCPAPGPCRRDRNRARYRTTALVCPARSPRQLGFDLWLISSNGAVTRSLAGETFHRDMMPAETCRRLCARRCKNSAVTPF